MKKQEGYKMPSELFGGRKSEKPFRYAIKFKEEVILLFQRKSDRDWMLKENLKKQSGQPTLSKADL